MSVDLKFNIVNTTKDNKPSFYDSDKKLLYVATKGKYRYFVEASTYDPDTGSVEYFLLLGATKFDPNCRLCSVDMYRRCQIRLKGKILEYVIDKDRRGEDVKVEYVESEDTYDIYSID